jgi:RimJ/RimL family protein N-acetyltransferase
MGAFTGLEKFPSLRGTWVTLEALSGANVGEVDALDTRRAILPQMGGLRPARTGAGRFGPLMLIRDNRSGAAVGTVESDEMIGYPGVAVLIVFADPELSRPGYGMEATALYVPTLFERGAEILHLEVLSFNREMIRILGRRHRPPDVRMRRHAYVGGHFWDLLMYGFDRGEMEAIIDDYRRVLPGGSGRIAALGSGRPQP